MLYCSEIVAPTRLQDAFEPRGYESVSFTFSNDLFSFSLYSFEFKSRIVRVSTIFRDERIRCLLHYS